MMTGFPWFLFAPHPPRPLPPPSKSLSRRLSIEGGRAWWTLDNGHLQRVVRPTRPSLVLFTIYCKQCLDKKLSLSSALPLKCIYIEDFFVSWTRNPPQPLTNWSRILIQEYDKWIFASKNLCLAVLKPLKWIRIRKWSPEDIAETLINIDKTGNILQIHFQMLIFTDAGNDGSKYIQRQQGWFQSCLYLRHWSNYILLCNLFRRIKQLLFWGGYQSTARYHKKTLTLAKSKFLLSSKSTW